MLQKLSGNRTNIRENYLADEPTSHDYHYTGEQTGGYSQVSACVSDKKHQANAKDVEYGYKNPSGVEELSGTKSYNSGCVSKATSQNPKDLLGMKKPSLTKIPPVAVAHEAMAMMDGASKYGPYNWRDKAVIAGIYIDACKRHLDQWFEGQEYASDSGVHHLGHARACLGILLDALETGNLIDDRPVRGDGIDLESVFKENMERWQAAVEKRNVQKTH